MESLAEQLKQLQNLRKKNLITEEEFSRMKALLLQGEVNSTPPPSENRVTRTPPVIKSSNKLPLLIIAIASVILPLVFTIYYLVIQPAMENRKDKMRFLDQYGYLKGSPQSVAAEYLNALKNKDWEKAKSLGNEDTKAKVDGIKGFGGDAGITEVRDVQCEIKDTEARCSFCCQNSGAGNVLLIRQADVWVVADKKEGGETVNTTSSDVSSSDTRPAHTNEQKTVIPELQAYTKGSQLIILPKKQFVRSDPNIADNIVQTVTRGYAFTVQDIYKDEVNRNWYYFSDDNVSGWVSGLYVTTAKEFGVYQYAAVNVSKAYFYSYEQENYFKRKKSYLVQGQEVRVFHKFDGFVYGEFTSNSGTTTSGWLQESDLW